MDTRKAIALVAYLAAAGPPIARATLADLLWPESDEERGRSALRRTLSALRNALGTSAIVASRDAVAVAEHVDIDVTCFRSSAAGGGIESLEAAVRLYRGELLAGFSLRDSPGFDDWLRDERRALSGEFAKVLARLVGLHSRAGSFDTALEYAGRWLEFDTLNEGAHREVMQLKRWMGDRPGAIEQYRACVSVLDRELGVEPLTETTELYRAIVEGRSPEPPEPEVEPATPIDAPALVGRDAEINLLTAILQKADPETATTIIEGPSGIGKSRLLEELLAVARKRGSRYAFTRCYPDETGLAYSPAIGLLRSGLSFGPSNLGGQIRAELARLLPELDEEDPLPPLDAPGATARFLGAMSDALSTCLEGDVRGLVVVDDAQWLDPSTLRWLTYMSRRLDKKRVAMILSYRSEEVPPDHDLRKIGKGARKLVLGPLDRTDVVRMTLATLGPDSDLGDRLHEATGGVPLYLVEYLAALGEGAAFEDGLPAGVKEALKARMTELPGASAQLLATAAIVGHPFDEEILRAASGRSEEEVVSGTELLCLRGLLVSSAVPAGRVVYDFASDNLREVVAGDVSPARARLLHRRIAESMVTRATRDQAASIARHFDRAGLDEEAARYMVEAGDHARELFANREAIDSYRAALAHGHPESGMLHEHLGDLSLRSGDYRAAFAAYETALADDRDAARLEKKLARVHLRLGEWPAAEARLERAQELCAEDPALVAHILAERSLVARRLEREEDARRFAQASLEAADLASDAAALAQAHNILGMIATHGGTDSVAEQHLTQSLDMARSAGEVETEISALNNLGRARHAAGDPTGAVEILRQALEGARTIDDRHIEAALLSNIADLLRGDGRTEEAEGYVRDSVAILADIADFDEPQPEIWKLSEW